MPEAAGIVLAGGRSSRMGTPKAELEWHGSTLLRRTAGILARTVTGPVVVVRAAGQDLPELPPEIEIAVDTRDGLGPVQGIATGLAAVGARADRAFVCSTDLPFLHPAFVRRVLRALADNPDADVALPLAGGFPQPLAAGYRTSLGPLADRLAAEGLLRTALLFDRCTVARLDEAALGNDPVLAALDPDLDSVLNVNTPADYQRARARPGAEVTIALSGMPAGDRSGARTVRAATVERAAAAAGIAFDGSVRAVLNGDQITVDGQAPLVTGDAVFFVAAGSGG
jgi:molybdopterin-guanine dinucleotide biosynthesis protein A